MSGAVEAWSGVGPAAVVYCVRVLWRRGGHGKMVSQMVMARAGDGEEDVTQATVRSHNSGGGDGVVRW